MKESIAILCAGGPAPGINTVIGSVTKVFLKSGYDVLGIHEGYKTIFTNTPNFEKLDFNFADSIYSRGGSALKMSRYKPKDSEFNTDFFVKHNVRLLVTIGGDDTASTANRISKGVISGPSRNRFRKSRYSLFDRAFSSSSRGIARDRAHKVR